MSVRSVRLPKFLPRPLTSSGDSTGHRRATCALAGLRRTGHGLLIACCAASAPAQRLIVSGVTLQQSPPTHQYGVSSHAMTSGLQLQTQAGAAYTSLKVGPDGLVYGRHLLNQTIDKLDPISGAFLGTAVRGAGAYGRLFVHEFAQNGDLLVSAMTPSPANDGRTYRAVHRVPSVSVRSPSFSCPRGAGTVGASAAG